MAAVDKEGKVVWDAKNSNLKMLVVNEDRTLDYVTTPGPEGIELAFTPAVCSHNSGCLSHSSHADTFLSLCYAYHCERYPFRVYQETLLHPCVLSTLLTPSSIVPLFLNDSHHTSGLHNPRLQVQYSFLLAFAACDWVNDTSRCSSASSSPSVEISLTYSTDTTLTLPLVSHSLVSSFAGCFLHPPSLSLALPRRSSRSLRDRSPLLRRPILRSDALDQRLLLYVLPGGGVSGGRGHRGVGGKLREQPGGVLHVYQSGLV